MKLPYIIAEIGLNHGGDIRLAQQMVAEAAAAGANAVKFQYVKAERLVSRHAQTYFQETDAPAGTQYAFFARSDQLERDDYEHLARLCRAMGVDFLCTVFDMESVHWIAPLVPAFKVASADITNIPLLGAIGEYRKSTYLSTGAATTEEIDAALEALFLARHDDKAWVDVTLLHCVLSYPTPLDQANLGVIPKLIHEWRGVGRYTVFAGRGYSDHTLFNLDVLTTAWLLGASVIEKHFTLDKTLPGNDHYHSMDPADLRALVAKFKELQAMIGDGEKRVLPIEEVARLNARQSVHATRDLEPDHVLTADDLTVKRPSTGLAPEWIRMLPGYRVAKAIRADEPITGAKLFNFWEWDPTNPFLKKVEA
jgi:Sialic acid synthase